MQKTSLKSFKPKSKFSLTLGQLNRALNNLALATSEIRAPTNTVIEECYNTTPKPTPIINESTHLVQMYGAEDTTKGKTLKTKHLMTELKHQEKTDCLQTNGLR